MIKLYFRYKGPDIIAIPDGTFSFGMSIGSSGSKSGDIFYITKEGKKYEGGSIFEVVMGDTLDRYSEKVLYAKGACYSSRIEGLYIYDEMKKALNKKKVEKIIVLIRHVSKGWTIFNGKTKPPGWEKKNLKSN